MRYYGVPVQTKIQANTLLLQGNELSASNIIKAVKKQRRYITLEKETKEYLKACEAKSIVNQTNIKALNDYVINRKTRSLNTTFLANSPIILDGLVLWLDAGVSDSYPAGGTIWKDLAGSNNGTLINGPTFSSGNGGSIVFDGTNDYVNISNSGFNLGVNFTVQLWTKITRFGGGPFGPGQATRASLISNSYPYSTNQGFFICATSQGPSPNFTATPGTERFFISIGQDQFSCGSSVGSLSAFVDKWVNLSASVNNTAPIRLYINGIEALYEGQQNGPSSLSYTGGPFSVGVRNNTEEFLQGLISQVSIYNKALTPTEILQNYNAMKGRFGL